MRKLTAFALTASAAMTFSPVASGAEANTDNAEKPAVAGEILTPPAPAEPRINGARVFGVRPGHPVLFTIPATGDRPMTFSAENLPAGLTLAADSGQITGTLDAPGTHELTLHAKNAKGESTSALKIVVGDAICLTPPMGWNSWNSWATAVDQQKVLDAAKAFVEKGLINHGWSYINIDDTWQGQRGGEFNGIQPNEKFPDMKGLADQIHGMGLKVGIYSTPWMTSYAGYVGGSSNDPSGKWSMEEMGGKNGGKFRQDGKILFATNDAKQWAAWGIDYLKYDWNPKSPKNAAYVPTFQSQVADMANALKSTGRDIVYSYSNSFPIESAEEVTPLLNCWRTTGDIRDTWWSVTGIWSQQGKWAKFEMPGHWNDPDMLVVGYVGWGPKLHASMLTPDEQYTHISLWCLLQAPLLIGADMTRMDDFTLSLLTNDEVLAIDQDPLGKTAVVVHKEGEVNVERPNRPNGAHKVPAIQVYAKELADGSHAVGLFNLNDTPQKVGASFSELGLSGKQVVRDVWRQKDLETVPDSVSAEVRPHGVVLLRLRDAQ
ncbi:MAG TPA: putative Ig domain-containing protein [Phycisphaerae bacterium]|nr:putative Ig domain-containing protein [Phycisphaerae bacterium]